MNAMCLLLLDDLFGAEAGKRNAGMAKEAGELQDAGN